MKLLPDKSRLFDNFPQVVNRYYSYFGFEVHEPIALPRATTNHIRQFDQSKI